MIERNGIRIFVDGFLKFDGKINGCSVCVEKRIQGEREEQLFFNRYLLKDIKNKKLRKLSENNKVTNFVVEYFAVYVGILLAKKYKADFLYSDARVIVRQFSKNNRYQVYNVVCKVWVEHCRNLLEGMNELTVLWIGRKKMVKTLGH